MPVKHLQVSTVDKKTIKNVSMVRFIFITFSLFEYLESNMAIGDRVIVSSGMGSRAGILKFMGETKFAPGNWCGVQLDEPSGKNDGTVDGVQYVFRAQNT